MLPGVIEAPGGARDRQSRRDADETSRRTRSSTPYAAHGGGWRKAPERVQRSPALSLSPFPASGRIDGPTPRPARRLNRATGILATSVLLDSAVEHYRGSFNNPAMIVPLIVSALTLGVGAHGTAKNARAAHRARQAIYATGAVTGLLVLYSLSTNVLKRPGAPAWQNLFYGAPVGAPMAILPPACWVAPPKRCATAPAAAVAAPGLPAGRLLRTRERPGSSGHHRRSCTVALSRCVPRSGDVCACDRPRQPAAHCCCMPRMARRTAIGGWRAGGCASLPGSGLRVWGSTPGACNETWAAGGTGARTC